MRDFLEFSYFCSIFRIPNKVADRGFKPLSGGVVCYEKIANENKSVQDYKALH